MVSAGSVREVWRYPVKSLGGEQPASVTVGPLGILGDRAWAVRDSAADRIRSAKKYPGLLHCMARSVGTPAAGVSHEVEVAMADGATFRAGEPRLDRALSAVAGQPVLLSRLRPATDLDSYRAAAPGPDPLAEARQVLGLEADEPIPDFSFMPKEKRGYASPPGTYFDSSHIHILTSNSLAAFAKVSGEDVDVRRFRPNFFVDTEGDGFVEQEWCGHRLRIGSVVLAVDYPTIRCSMTTHSQPGLEANPKVMRALVRETQQKLGVYATVIEQGEVAPGDTVEVLD
jgi:uncharacterized protein YcbX